MQLILIVAVVALNLQSTAAYSCYDCTCNNSTDNPSDPVCSDLKPNVPTVKMIENGACFNKYVIDFDHQELGIILMRGTQSDLPNNNVSMQCFLYNEGPLYGKICTCANKETCNEGGASSIPDEFTPPPSWYTHTTSHTETSTPATGAVPNLMSAGKLATFIIVSLAAAVFILISG